MILDNDFETAKMRSKVHCRCDYCGLEFERLKHNILRSWKNIKSDSCNRKECVQEKRVRTNRLLFGTDCPFQNEEIKKGIVEKNLRNLGVKYPLQNKDVRAKQRKTVERYYGVTNVFANEEIKTKIKQHWKELGVSNAFQLKHIQDKQRLTMQQEYGCQHALQNPDLRQKAMDTCVSNHGYFPANQYGETQKEIQNWLNSMGNDFKSSRSLVPGSEIDLYDEVKRLAIEYCGLYWHNEGSPEPRKRSYHFEKYKKCAFKGVQLLTIFSDEWLHRETQCKSHIQSLLGIYDSRLYARCCEVVEIKKDEGRQFIEQYHIQGKNKLGVIFYGLLHKKELVGVISLGRHNRNYSDLVLDRLCFKTGVQVVGGASKLFNMCCKWATAKGYKEIISFSDNRWSTGKVYTAMDFRLDRECGPDYSYVNSKNANFRLSKQSQRKTTSKCPQGLTESQWAYQRGLVKIWDCGKKRWRFPLLQEVVTCTK